MAQQEQSEGEKTEPPSQKKLRDARAKGQVARSQEVVTTISLLAVLVTVWFIWDLAINSIISMFDVVAILAQGDFKVNSATALAYVFEESIYILAPIIAVVIVADIFANNVQFGAIFTFEKLIPKLEYLNPIEGAKRIFSSEKLFELFKELLKILVLSSIFYYVIKSSFGAYLLSLSCGLDCQADLTKGLMLQLLFYAAILFAIVAAADLAFQRWDFHKNLRMTRHELKRERKESEGDPKIKGQRKQLGQELIMSDSGERARDGTAVVVNPTHLAVVIKYEPESKSLPLITAKGMDHNAAFLRGEAEKAGVPVFRNVKLAHALYHTTDIDDYVPSELYDVVAEVLVWVAQNRELLYKGPLKHGVIDMDMEKHEQGMKA